MLTQLICKLSRYYSKYSTYVALSAKASNTVTRIGDFQWSEVATV